MVIYLYGHTFIHKRYKKQPFKIKRNPGKMQMSEKKVRDSNL